jgi:3-hydroxyisobutyrate dehydrogenase-like beta-hydroxyacid dehydrogenase
MEAPMKPRVCLLGFGEVGQALARGLRSRVAQLTAWDLQFDQPGSGPSQVASAMGVLAAPDAANAVAYVDVIISAVTAAQIVPAAQSATALSRDAWYLDLNSTSPAAKIAAAGVIDSAGGRFVEGAVMSPIQPRGAASPILIGGEHAAAFQPLAASLGFTDLRVMAGKLGSASAAKMCRSVLVKGLEALVLESLLAARRHGVEEVVLESLRGLKLNDWPQDARYMMSRALLHGARRAEEMREVARTVREAGLASHMSASSALWQEWAAAHGHAAGEKNLRVLLDELLDTLPAPGAR